MKNRAALLDPCRYSAAPTFDEYLEDVDAYPELWRGVYERVRLPEEEVARARRLWADAPAGAPPIRLLALSADWCGDAVNSLPVVARLAEALDLELRVLDRDENPDLMDAHLTNGRSRSVPVVIAYDASFNELGWWGPRPAELQRWVLDEGMRLPSPERYKHIRRWYAQDRGRTTVEEFVAFLRASLDGVRGRDTAEG